jgi:hypothetical protein
MEIENLTQYLHSKKYKLKINEIICIIEKFSKANDGIFDDIKISTHKNHSVYIFTDMKHLDNRFSGINTHNAGNSGGVDFSVGTTATNFTITVTDAAAGQITMSMNSANTANVTPGRYVYDVLITSGASVKTRIIEGIVTILPSVTR